MPGVIDMRCEPNGAGVVEIEEKRLSQWLPWHFDHCYNNELNRAGVLRALEIPPEGGMTGFADCIELYNAVSPELRDKLEGRNIVYTLDLAYANMRFGKPRTFREIVPHPGHYKMTELAKTLPRAIHPAVWTRPTGEKVLHISPWMAVGIEGEENPEGDALLAAACEEILDKVHPYFHRWTTTDMLIWDNWRVLHSVSGHDPKYPRRMQRTTIKGDYGLGYFENNRTGDKLLEMTV
jgi:taurine dioxygenase